jgi:putative membrane protein insertion efficiency factor
VKFLRTWKDYWQKKRDRPKVQSLSTFRLFFKGIINFYRWVLSPLLGGQCRFYPSCSEYAMEALDHHSPFSALLLIVRRILRCHPFHPGGYDPVLTKQNILLSDSRRGTRDAGLLT